MMHISLDKTDIIAPNFKKRLSGVTSTIVQLIPIQREQGVRIAAFGFGLPDRIPRISWFSLIGLWKRPSRYLFRIWHARRNIEMVVGLFMRDILRMKLRLVFTSASQRHHKPFTKWLIARMNRVIATSHYSASYLEVPCYVIMHGIDCQRFSPVPQEEDTVPSVLLRGKYSVGCFGRIRHQKGTDLFVNAMIALLPRYPEWIAVVAGRATSKHKSFEKNLKEKVAEAGLSERIIFTGEILDTCPWYRYLTLYVAPSRHEGFGLTPLEAMASQTAVITSDAGAYTEMVSKEAGMVVSAGDEEALKKSVEFYFQDPSRAINEGKFALEYVRKNFPLVKELDAISAVYQDLFSETE